MMRILFFLFVEIMHVFIEISISIIVDTSINVLFTKFFKRKTDI